MKNQTELMNDLKGFGLNPNDWTLVKEKSNTYKISNTKDLDFIFKGKTKLKDKKMTWDFLTLQSI